MTRQEAEQQGYVPVTYGYDLPEEQEMMDNCIEQLGDWYETVLVDEEIIGTITGRTEVWKKKAMKQGQV
jgi:hypothetical protein